MPPTIQIPRSLYTPISKRVEDWEKLGIIKKAPPGCRWNFPLLAAPKKDEFGKYTDVRVCVDYRPLNNVLEDDIYSIPLVTELIQETRKFNYSSTIDLKHAFHQLKIKEDHRERTADAAGH